MKNDSVFQPDWPFMHHYMTKSGALQCHASLQDGFKAAYKEPCVVFAGTPPD